MNVQTQKSLKLANSYLDEVAEEIQPLTNITQESAPELLKTIDLALKQLDKAEQVDPNAKMLDEVDSEVRELDITTLRATALLFRGLAQNIGLGERATATKSIEQSLKLVEDFPNAHFALGSIYADMGKKEQALKHLQRSIELDPDNLEYQKSVDRLENISGNALMAEALGDRKPLLIKLTVNVILFIVYMVIFSYEGSGQPPALLMIVILVWGFFGFRWLVNALLELTNLTIFASLQGWGITYFIGSIVVAATGFIVIPFLVFSQIRQLKAISQ